MEHFIEPTIPKRDYKKRWSDIEGFTAEYIRSDFPRYFIEKRSLNINVKDVEDEWKCLMILVMPSVLSAVWKW